MKRTYFKTMGMIIVLLILIVGAGVFSRYSGVQDQAEQKKSIRVGVALYRGDDTFINTLLTQLESYTKQLAQENQVKITLDIVESKENQNTQNQQIERWIALDYDVLCVNMVDRSEAATIIDKAMNSDTPLVFFNREPVAEDMNRWDKMYYVGTDAKVQAILQGEMILEAYKKDKAAIDTNGDGIIQYAILEGETRHQDSTVRTEWSVQTLKSGGMVLEKIVGGIANWERIQAAALTEQWMTTYGDQIELIISNNDDMAVGAAESIEELGMDFNNIYGIDGTDVGLDMLEKGKIKGTVLSNPDLQAQAIMDIAYALATHQKVEETVILEGGKYVRVPQYKMTKAGAQMP